MPFPDLGNRYKFIRLIDKGGTASVYLVHDVLYGKFIAVKALFANYAQDKEMLQKFMDEINIYLMLDHPNIVNLVDCIHRNNTYYLVMEFVDGQTIEDYVKNVTGPIPSEVAIAMMIEIVKGIEYAHNTPIGLSGNIGVLHLDFKPGNVLISKQGDIKIIDYGIAQASQEERSKKIMGTPMYMSPEQLDISKKLDVRTDIYQLGVSFHEMVTGYKPYNREMSKSEIFDNIKNKPLNRVMDIYPHSDERVQNIIDMSTAKDPNDRYQSCTELREALEELI